MKIKQSFCFGVYIKTLMIVYMFLMIASFPELNSWIHHKQGNLFSRMFALTVSIVCIIVFVFSSVYWIKYSNIKIEENDKNQVKKNKCLVCFSGLKTTKIQRFHTPLFFLRRLLVCVLLFLFKDLESNTKLPLFLMIQVVFLIVLVILRSPKLIKDQIIEIFNELVFTLLVLWMVFHQEVSDWKEQTQDLFLYMIIASFALPLLINIAVLVKLVLRRSKSNRVATHQNTKVIESKMKKVEL